MLIFTGISHKHEPTVVIIMLQVFSEFVLCKTNVRLVPTRRTHRYPQYMNTQKIV